MVHRIVGNGPGGRDSGPAVIQAFEHAYYVQRDGEAVDVLLKFPPVGDEGIHKQWITTMPADGGTAGRSMCC